MTLALAGVPRWLWILLSVFLLYHLVVMPISPLPWFDETYFASMSLHFMETGEFAPPVGPLLDYYYPQAKAYGPGYFLLISAFFQVFGFSMEAMRTPAILCGFFSLLLVYRILAESGISPLYRSLVVIVLLFDTIFLQNIHSARMDSLALFLSLAGLWALMRGFREAYLYWYMLAGILFGLALFSTPRIAVNLIGPSLACVLFFFSGPTPGKFLRLAWIPLGIIGIYSIWVFWGFGGYAQAYAYFFGAPKETLYFKSLADGYISSRIYIPRFQYPLIIIFILFLARMVYERRNADWVFWISIFNLVAFYALVSDTGIYSIFSVPWMLMAMAFMAQGLQSKHSGKVIRAAFICLIGINLGIFSLKNLVVWMYSPARDFALAQKQVASLIPKGSRVIGDEAFYYAVLKSGSDFQYLDRGAGTELRLDYHKNQYRYQYIIVRQPVVNQYELGRYAEKHSLRKVGEIRMPNPGSVAQGLGDNLAKIGIDVPKGYAGTVYMR